MFQVYCCGTARADRCGFPSEITVKSMRGRKRGDDMWRMKAEILAQVWIDSRPVHFLSSIHPPEHDAAVLGADKTVKRKGKRGERDGIDIPAPPCVRAYNKHMGGVDFADRIIKYYNCARRSCRWNRRVLFHLLELSIHNAFVLESFYRDHHGGTNNRLQRSHQAFREELADTLIGGYRAGQTCAGRPSDVYNSETRSKTLGATTRPVTRAGIVHCVQRKQRPRVLVVLFHVV